MIKSFISIFLVSIAFHVFSQEIELELKANPILSTQYSKFKKTKTISVFSDTIDIFTKPFLDDFSKDDFYPDAALWLDSGAFINRDYPIAPPTLGVATLDGASKTGCPYDTLFTGAGSAPADTLISKPIKLSYLPSDSIYLSFFWQAKGRGNDPENSDTLLLQFKNDSSDWQTVWYKNGYNPSTSDTNFRLVMIPITNTAYLFNGFQFRFRNYATVSGNVDHWHIDYVLLDKNRNMADTIFDDVAFVYNAKSLLKNYYAMPWEQYTPAEMKTNLSFFIRNNNSSSKNLPFTDTIFSSAMTPVSTYSLSADNILPYSTNGYYNGIFANPAISTNPPNYFFDSITKDTSFILEAVIKPSPDKDKWNDTLRFTQHLSNYYAYDDGTAEGGYGLNQTGGQIAYKFTLNVPDTLFAVQMLFNWIGPNVNQQSMRVRVWNDNAGVPGTVIDSTDITSPNYQYVYNTGWGNLTNMFYPYVLKAKKYISGTFYVGFVQYTNPTTTILNIGLDKNTDSRNKMYYNIGSGWAQSSLNTPCSWMIRPVLGSTKGLLTVPEEQENISSFSIYPNPSQGKFQVAGFGFQVKQAEVFNLFGEKIYDSTIFENASIDISEQSAGIYLLRITDEKGIVHSQKLILTR